MRSSPRRRWSAQVTRPGESTATSSRRTRPASRSSRPANSSPRRSSRTGPWSARQALLEQLLALLAALAAGLLRTAEEAREIVIAVALSVFDIGLQAQCVAQRLLGEPDQVVVLVLRAGDI